MKKSELRFWRTNIDNNIVSEYANYGLTADVCFERRITGVRSIELRMFRDDYHYMGSTARTCEPEERISRRRLVMVTREEWTDGWYYAFVCMDGKVCLWTKAYLKDYEVLTCSGELLPMDSRLLSDEEREKTIGRYLYDDGRNLYDDGKDDMSCDDMGSDDGRDEFEIALDNFLADAKGCIRLRTKEDEEAEETKRALEQMVGLKRLKEEMEDTRVMALFTKERRALGLDSSTECRHHMLFMGNPGTGKTTVARLVGKAFHSMGLLSKGHTVETERSKLVGEFIGVTEKNMREVIEKARGGVLFIDEAYTLISTGDSKDFGKEVLNALLTVMAEPNPDMIVILAGYEDKMRTLMSSNPGLKERFTNVFHFDDYTPAELMEIARGVCRKGNYLLTPEADARMERLIKKAVEQRDEYFGNGRWVHNLIEHGVIKNMARRVMTSPHRPTSRKMLCTIMESDVAAAEQDFIRKEETRIKPLRIGFTA